ncbi:hypothetical protein [Candidatus Vondammii sp. HM_W22]|uniref:hypothetical protein n=1 Tax=Candidatus Vondammii sp. HM_W22 TaxID=2687299 RepID=UPI002E7AF42E|nr:hypothetical protein [Candidatus Vondammii sp. HM_W22]
MASAIQRGRRVFSIWTGLAPVNSASTCHSMASSAILLVYLPTPTYVLEGIPASGWSIRGRLT